MLLFMIKRLYLDFASVLVHCRIAQLYKWPGINGSGKLII
jgi:hypothetical protein